MVIRPPEEVKTNIENFSKEYLKLLLHKKSIDVEIKDIRTNYKEDGVPVSAVIKVLNKIKTSKKKTDSEKQEEDVIFDWLENNKEIDDSICALMAK